MKKDSWDTIPASTRDALLTAAARAGKEIRANSRKESNDAVAAMKKRGLTVHEPSAEIVALWRKEAEKIYPDIRGRLIPAEVFDEVQRHIREFRASETNKCTRIPSASLLEPVNCEALAGGAEHCAGARTCSWCCRCSR